MVTAATIYMSLLGPEGLRRVALESHAQTNRLAALAGAIAGVGVVFSATHFHEVVLRLPVPAAKILDGMRNNGILAGIDLNSWYPELKNCLLVCATETKSDQDIDDYVRELKAQIDAAGAVE